MLPLVRVLAPLLNVAGLVLIAQRRRLLHILKADGAEAGDRAIPLETTGVTRWWLRRLRSAGVIRQTSAGLYWLDPVAHSRYRRERIGRVVVVLVLAAVAWAALNWTCCGP